MDPLEHFPPSPERDREFSGVIGFVLSNFIKAQAADNLDSKYKHVLIDRDVATKLPLAKFGMASDLESSLRENKGAMIEIIVPVDEADAQEARSLLVFEEDPDNYFLIRNTRTAPAQTLRITRDNFEQLYEPVAGTTPDEFDQSYMDIICLGEIVPLR